jgi:hypothetical protein
MHGRRVAAKCRTARMTLAPALGGAPKARIVEDVETVAY